jgi:hypothetical protein
MTLRDLLTRSARRSKPGGDLVAEEPAVTPFAVEDRVGIDPDAVGRDLQELFDEGADRRILTAVRRESHELDLAFVRVPPEIFRRRAIEPPERVRQSDMPHFAQRATLAAKNRHCALFTVSVEHEDRGFVEPGTVKGCRGVTEMMLMEVDRRNAVTNEPGVA